MGALTKPIVSYFSGFLKALTAFQTIQKPASYAIQWFWGCKGKKDFDVCKKYFGFFLRGVRGVIGVLRVRGVMGV